jgi:hypothetical protein
LFVLARPFSLHALFLFLFLFITVESLNTLKCVPPNAVSEKICAYSFICFMAPPLDCPLLVMPPVRSILFISIQLNTLQYAFYVSSRWSSFLSCLFPRFHVPSSPFLIKCVFVFFLCLSGPFLSC